MLTSNSVGSAWIHTEVAAANGFYKKKILTLIDADDEHLLLIVNCYLKNQDVTTDLLSPVLEKYKSSETNEHRIKNFKKKADNILQLLHLYSNFSLYPPVHSPENSQYLDLREALSYL